MMSGRSTKTIGMYVSSLTGVEDWELEETLDITSFTMNETVGKAESG